MNEREPDIEQLLAQWKAPETPAWFKSRVMRLIRENAQEREPVFSRWWLKVFRLPQFGLALAILVLLTLAVVFWGSEMSSESRDEAMLRSALESFASYTREQTSWGGDPFL